MSVLAPSYMHSNYSSNIGQCIRQKSNSDLSFVFLNFILSDIFPLLVWCLGPWFLS